MGIEAIEMALGIAMIFIGIVSFMLAFNARGKLHEASELKTIITRCSYIIFFLLCYSIWHVIREAFHLKKTYGVIIEFPEYIFISIAYIMVYRSAKTLYDLAKMFKEISNKG